MEHLKILNSKEKKAVLQKINEQWDANFSTGLGMLKNNEDKLFLMNPAVSALNFSKLRINSMGLYVAEIKEEVIRLSIEGSQLIGPLAKKNVVDISDSEVGTWLMGEDLERQVEGRGFIIIRHDGDFLGCGRAVKGKILNFVGKNRRVSAVH